MKWQDIVDSENGYHIDWRNLSHCQQQSYSGLTSPRRILWYYHSNEISQTERLCSGIFFIGFYKENFEFFCFIFFAFYRYVYTQEWKGESAFFLSYFFFRASPYGWICGVISTKTPSSIILCLNILLYQRNLRHWRNATEWINGKVYKLLPLERKVGKKQLECVRKNHVCRITNQYVMSVLMHFKLWWDKITVQIEFISGQWCSSTAKILNLFKLYALRLLYKTAIDRWLQIWLVNERDRMPIGKYTP